MEFKLHQNVRLLLNVCEIIIENTGALQTFWVAWKSKIVLNVALKKIIWIMHV
jgi:hypothetical protein